MKPMEVIRRCLQFLGITKQEEPKISQIDYYLNYKEQFNMTNTQIYAAIGLNWVRLRKDATPAQITRNKELGNKMRSLSMKNYERNKYHNHPASKQRYYISFF